MGARGVVALGSTLVVLMSASALAHAPPDKKAEPPSQADPDYSEAALKLLPKEELDQLPKTVTRFLRDEHYEALRERCPQPDIEERKACLDAKETQEVLATMLGFGIIGSMLERMDADLPRRLSDEDYASLAGRCSWCWR